MQMLFLFFALLQWLSFIYLPLVVFYGIVRTVSQPDVMNTITSPFLGVKTVSVKSGFIIWMIQITFFGIILYEIGQWIHLGINPLIQIG